MPRFYVHSAALLLLAARVRPLRAPLRRQPETCVILRAAPRARDAHRSPGRASVSSSLRIHATRRGSAIAAYHIQSPTYSLYDLRAQVRRGQVVLSVALVALFVLFLATA